MPTLVAIAQTPGQLMAQLCDRIFPVSTSALEPIPTITLTTWNGKRAVRVVYPSADPDLLYYFVLVPLGATDKAPVRYFVDSNGFETSRSAMCFDDSPNIAHRLAFWIENIVELKASILDAWTDATIEPPQTGVSEFVTGRLLFAGATVIAVADGDVVSTRDQLMAYIQYGEDFEFAYSMPAPPVCGSQLSVAASCDVSTIAKALEQLAFTDFDIQFNHGQAVFSVRGRTNIG